MLLASEWLRLSSIWVRGWIQQVLAVLPVVARSAGVEGVAGGERCGGRRFGRKGENGYGGAGARLSGWGAPWSRGEANGGTGWVGEGLVTANVAGAWRRPWLPEMEKMASSGRNATRGAGYGGLEVV